MPDIAWNSTVSPKSTEEDKTITGKVVDVVFPDEFEDEYSEFKRREQMWGYEKEEEDRRKATERTNTEGEGETPHRMSDETEVTDDMLQQLRDTWMSEITDLTRGVP